MKFSQSLKTTLQSIDNIVDQAIAMIPPDQQITVTSDQSEYSADEISEISTQISQLKDLLGFAKNLSYQLKQAISNMDT